MKVEERRALRSRIMAVKEIYRQMKRKSKKHFLITVSDLAALTKIPERYGMDWRDFDINSFVDCTLTYDENKYKIKQLCKEGDEI